MVAGLCEKSIRPGPRLFSELLPHRSEPPTELLAVTSARICNVCNDCRYILVDRSVVPRAPFRQHRDLPWHANHEVTSKPPPQAIFCTKMADFIGFFLKIGACGALKPPFEV